MPRRRYRRCSKIPVGISALQDIRGDKIDIVLSANGRKMTVNRNDVDFYPGHVLLPSWLYQKILPSLLATEQRCASPVQ